MPIPETYKAFRRTAGDLPRTVSPSIEQLPRELGPHDVLLKIHAVSLNFRDVAMLHGRYPVEVIECGIPCSDAAAEVAAVGRGQSCHLGDRLVVNNHVVYMASYPRQLPSRVPASRLGLLSTASRGRNREVPFCKVRAKCLTSGW